MTSGRKWAFILIFQRSCRDAIMLLFLGDIQMLHTIQLCGKICCRLCICKTCLPEASGLLPHAS